MDKRIGAQLYTLREFCKTEKDLADTLKKVKDIGYKVIQVSGVGPLSAKEIRHIADAYGLEIVCTHRPMEEFLHYLPELIEYHQTLGCRVAGLGMMPPEYLSDEASLARFIDETSHAAQELAKCGMVFSYHNHAMEFSRLGERFVFDLLMENTPADCYYFLADTYWMAVAGMDPSALLKKYASRYIAIHYKDLQIKPQTNTVQMAEVGEGTLRWDEIIAASHKTSAAFALVEQDICQRDPFESMRMSYEYLTKKGFR